MAEQDPLRTPDDSSKMTRVSRTGAFWLLLVLMAALLVQLVRGQEEAAIEFTYTEFKTQLDADNILEVTVVESRRIEGELRAPRMEEGREFQNFTTMLPGEISSELLADLEQHDVEISGQMETRGWGSLLVGMLPWVLFIAFWIWIFRTMQGGGNRAFQFGRSKVKMISPEAPKVTFADIAGAEEAKNELEEVSNPGGPYADKHLDEVRTRHLEERPGGFSGDSPREKRLARSGGAHQENALGQTTSEP